MTSRIDPGTPNGFGSVVRSAGEPGFEPGHRSRQITRSFSAIVAPAPVVEVESLTIGTVDANVDIRCAVKLTAFERGAKTLPLIRVDWLEDIMLDRCGRRRSPATIPSNRRGLPPGNAGHKYQATPLTDDEVFALMAQCASDRPSDIRDRALIGLLWRTGLRIAEALALVPDDLDQEGNRVKVRHGKGDKARLIAMDDFGFELIAPWLELRRTLPVGETTIFCVTLGRSRGEPMGATGFRTKLHKIGRQAGITKRVHCHGLRHSCAVWMSRAGVPVPIIQIQFGHSNPATTGIYLRGISAEDVVSVIIALPRPVQNDELTLAEASGMGPGSDVRDALLSVASASAAVEVSA